MANNSQRIESSTRTARVNVSIVAALIVLLGVAIFVAQNTDSVSIKFLGWNGHIGLGLALLLSVIAGGLVVALFGSARILQLRHRARKMAPDPVVTEPAVDLTTDEKPADSTV